MPKNNITILKSTGARVEGTKNLQYNTMHAITIKQNGQP